MNKVRLDFLRGANMVRKFCIFSAILVLTILVSCQIEPGNQSVKTLTSSLELNKALKGTYLGILKVSYCSTFNFIWNDRGSGASMDGAFYQPIPPAGYYNIGYYAQGNYNYPNGVVMTVAGEVGAGKPLAYPQDYSLIWADHGSGANLDGAFWRPIPPMGYVALGTVVTLGYNKPNLAAVVCVRGDLITTGRISNLIWNDRNSGAYADIGTWSIVPQNYNPILGDNNGLPSGMFLGVGNYSTPSDTVYVLKGNYYTP
jgi:hypothetical protein